MVSEEYEYWGYDIHDEHPKLSKGRGILKPFYPPPARTLDEDEIHYTIKAYSATHDKGKWARHSFYADKSYAGRRLKEVGEQQVIDVNQYPTYFAEATVVTFGSEIVIGGIRVHKTDCNGRLPVMDEIEGYVDASAFDSFINSLNTSDLSHGGGLWIDRAYGFSSLAGDLARAGVLLQIAIQCRWCLGAGHHYVLDAWGSLGLLPTLNVPSFPYPSKRFETYILLGGPETWPDELAKWAKTQIGDSTLDGAGPRFTVEPMRM